MIAVYIENKKVVKADYRCEYIPSVGEEVIIKDKRYTVDGRSFDLDCNKITIRMRL